MKTTQSEKTVKVEIPLAEWARREIINRHGSYRRFEIQTGLSANAIANAFAGRGAKKTLEALATELRLPAELLRDAINESVR